MCVHSPEVLVFCIDLSSPVFCFGFFPRFVFAFWLVCFPLKKKKKDFFFFLTQLSAQLPEVKAAGG